MLRRVAGYAAGLYLLFAVIGRFVEGMGAVRCGCASDCWCHRPRLEHVPVGLSLRSPSRHRRLIRHSSSPMIRQGEPSFGVSSPPKQRDDHYESRETTSWPMTCR